MTQTRRPKRSVAPLNYTRKIKIRYCSFSRFGLRLRSAMGSSPSRCCPKADPPVSTVRWGVLGCGKIASDFCTAMSHVRGARLVAVAARDKDRASTFGSQFGVLADKCYGTYEDLVDDEDIDVVYVATMHVFHKSAVLLALDAGRGVLCEKPLAMNEKDAAEIVRTARQAGLFLMEGMWTRCFPVAREATRMIRAGDIGEVTTVICDFGKRVPRERATDATTGRGATLDMGVYTLATAHLGFGALSPNAVLATGVLDAKTGIDVSASVSLRFGEQGTASLHYTKLARTPEKARFVGSGGMLTLTPAHAPTTLTIDKFGARLSEIRRPTPAMPGASFHYPGGEGFVYEIQEVCECIREGRTESRCFTLDETLRLAKTTDQVRAALGVHYKGERETRRGASQGTDGKREEARRRGTDSAE